MHAIIKPGPEAGGASVPLSQSWSDSLEPHIGRRAPGTVWESQVTRYTNTQNTNTNMNGLTHIGGAPGPAWKSQVTRYNG